jgi:hypothetical protein
MVVIGVMGYDGNTIVGGGFLQVGGGDNRGGNKTVIIGVVCGLQIWI